MRTIIHEMADARDFPFTNRIIQGFIGGSRMYLGTELSRGDLDLYGIFIEPLEKVIGLEKFEHFVTSSNKQNDTRNTKEDFDMTLYGLRRWAELACKGNPTALAHLFAPMIYHNEIWDMFTSDKTIFLAKSHLEPFFGYANQQLQRLYNGRGPKDVNRPFVESQYGYDTKYAMHIVRLLMEAKQLMTDGVITYPSPDATMLSQIRNGEMKLYDFEKFADNLMINARVAQSKSSLPAKPNRQKINQKLVSAYIDFNMFINSGG
jgi:uncharacterized protein